jgi:putative addiction module component (TIGR02574 family)
MSVQTIPAIDDMTPVQKVELMEELWKSMSRNPEDIQSPAWHGEVLKEREEALKNGTDSFISLEEAEAYIRKRTR